ncbi:MAG: acyl-CoA dehydrogenase [Planctomycetota bacterium]|nr:MAG: acyl-CoA dehydrogenase [Planctomycetota bacterium]
MDFAPSAEHKELCAEVLRFARAELNDGIEERDRASRFPRELWDKCGDMRLQGLMVPEEYGGVGLDPLGTALVLESLGYGCRDAGLVFSICAHLLACVVPIWKHGSEEQKRRYLPKLSSGEWIAVNGMTEPGSGSDAFAMRTRAVPRGDDFVLNGAKTFSSNGPVADVAVVYAATAPEKRVGGISCFLVEKGTPGFRAAQQFEKLGLRTSSIGELLFEDCALPQSALLGGVGAGETVFSESMAWERICLVAAHVGHMQRLLEQAVEHARTRQAFGKPIGKQQAVSHRIADMKVRLEAARLLTYKAAWRLDRARDIALDASITKLYASEALLDSALDTVRVLGGTGFMEECDAARALRDAVGGVIYSGTSDIQRDIIARWLGL